LIKGENKKMAIKIADLDPLPLGDEGPLTKFRHHLKIGDRVKCIETGHCGKVVNLDDKNRIHVALDGGFNVYGRPDEFEPEQFGSARTDSAQVSPVLKAFDPLPIGDEPTEPEPAASPAAQQLLAPFLKASGGLQKALEAGTVSAHDCFLIKRCVENVENARIVVDPFGGIGGYEDENITTLRVMSEKYADTLGTVSDDALHKRLEAEVVRGAPHKAAGGDRVDELIRGAVDGLNAGHNIILPPECRIPFMRVPSLKTLVASGRICFDYAG
jgi:hypothetical protein